MSKRTPSDMAASVRQRLLNRIRQTGEDANWVWTRYAIERLLYRLSVSDHAQSFMLKGATLLTVWTGQPHRPTLDVDLLGFGDDSAERLEAVFRDVCEIAVEPDGLSFDPGSVEAAAIREDQEYGRHRVTMKAFMGKMRIHLQVDVAFGDAVAPSAQAVDYPTLLSFPAPRVRACPRETVVAEKLHAMVVLGIANSRMKDFFDVYALAQGFEFSGEVLSEAARATFERRETPLPSEMPLALTDAFAGDAAKRTQWRAFLRRSRLDAAPDELGEVIAVLTGFLGPVLRSLSGGVAFTGHWPPTDPWQ